jgi:hypothetical protein
MSAILIRGTPRSALSVRLRSQRGQVAIEMLGSSVLLLAAALAAWQLALLGWSAVGAQNAARTAARAYSRTGDAGSARRLGYTSLSDAFLGSGAVVDVGDGPEGSTDAHAHVVVRVPLVFPGIPSPFTMPASADVPKTG